MNQNITIQYELPDKTHVPPLCNLDFPQAMIDLHMSPFEVSDPINCLISMTSTIDFQ